MVRKWVSSCTLIALSRKKDKLRRQGDGERRREEERGGEGEKRRREGERCRGEGGRGRDAVKKEGGGEMQRGRREGERCRGEGGRVRKGYTHYHKRVDGMILKMNKDCTFVDEGVARSHFMIISTFSQEIGTSFASVSKPKPTPTPTTFIHPLPHHLHPSSPPLHTPTIHPLPHHLHPSSPPLHTPIIHPLPPHLHPCIVLKVVHMLVEMKSTYVCLCAFLRLNCLVEKVGGREVGIQGIFLQNAVGALNQCPKTSLPPRAITYFAYFPPPPQPISITMVLRCSPALPKSA